MYQRYFECVLFLLSLTLNNGALIIQKRSTRNNETLLSGQILGPIGDSARNLKEMLLSIDVFYNKMALHQSLVPIENSTFPLDYTIILNKHDFEMNKEKFSVIAMIWQPAYISNQKVVLSENETNLVNIPMQAIRFVMIRGKIVHSSSNDHFDLPAKHVKLELIQDDHHQNVIDQVDFICSSNHFPCPFEYLLNTERIKNHHKYRLEAIISDQIVVSRKSAHQHHVNHKFETDLMKSKNIQIDPTKDNVFENYDIFVTEVK